MRGSASINARYRGWDIARVWDVRHRCRAAQPGPEGGLERLTHSVATSAERQRTLDTH